MNYDELLAPAAKSMRPSGIRKFFDLAAEMPHCISLGVGEPDFKTPWTIRDAGIRSLEQGRTRYTANAGIKELRAEICRYLARRMELNYQPSEVLVTVGGSEAIDLTIRALVKPGDEVIIPEPCFVCYEPITSLTGGVPVHIATKVEDDFRLRADQLRAAYGERPVSFTTDCICGFPGETQADFEESCEFLKKIGFLKVHVFPYSRRSGTPAYDFPDQVHEREKQARSREMNAIAEDIRREVLAGCEGSEDDVLLETPLSGTLFTGYTRLYVPVVVSAPGHKSGEIVHVRLGSYDGERVRA